MMKDQRKIIVATRHLLFCRVGETVRRRLNIRIYMPYHLKDGDVSFEFTKGTAGCDVEYDGISHRLETAYGADTVQALEIALGFDKTLRRLSQKYVFFFETGEPYFED